MLKTLLLVFLGGGLGSIIRYFLSLKLNIEAFPYGTLIANALGSFMMGICIWLMENKGLSQDFRYLVMIGFLGGFTTFSSFGAEVFNMLRNHEIFRAIIYISISNFLVILFAILGFFIMYKMFKVG